MTTQQAIAHVKNLLLDETGAENYKDAEILMALEQAQVQKAREYFQRGRKEALVPCFRRVQITGNGVTGINLTGQLPNAETPMFFEACLVRLRDNGGRFRHAKYIPPDKYVWYRFNNPNAAGSVSGQLNYSYIGNLLYHNGAGTECTLAYYKYPLLLTASTPLSLAEFTHSHICDRAAYILYKKDSMNPDQMMLGQIADTMQLTEQKTQ